jgi:phage gp36-like protein
MYCQKTDLTGYVLNAYLTAAEEQTPGIVDQTLANVSGEIDDALRSRFELPLAEVPGTLTRIAAVMASYRIVGAITSVMASEGGSNNEWIPLQTQYKQAVKDLEAVRSGKLDIGLKELGEEPRVDTETMVVTRRPKGLLRGWK